jgi:hypothetical protein
MEMLERVARALCTRLGCDPDTQEPSMVVTDMGRMGIAAAWNGPLEALWKRYEAEARTAIEAMKEPTPEMIAAVGSEWGSALEANFTTMIDAALNPVRSSES